MTSSATSAHPLFDTYNVLTEEELKNRDPSDESTLSLIYFRSPSHPDRRDIEPVDIFHCAFTPGQELYFTATVDPSLAPAPNGRHLVDLEMVAAGKDLPVPVSLVCMNHEHPGPVDPIMVRLYTTIKKMVDQSRLSPEAATLIDKYLGIK